MKPAKQLPRLAVIGIAYLVSLAAAFTMVPPAVWQYDVVAPTMSAAALMLMFGPYLLAVGCTTGFLPGLGALWTLAVVLPFYVLHVVFIVVVSKRTSLWRLFGRFGERARKTVVVLWAIVSALGVWYELPCVTRYDIAAAEGKVPSEGLRLAVISDLHSCNYGYKHNALVDAVARENPDAVLLVGDIADDRLPDRNAHIVVGWLATKFPCFYVAGNHEYWSERVEEIKAWIRGYGATVLEGGVRTIEIKGTPIDFCGIDDPTYMTDGEWLGQLAAVAAETAGSARLKILLSHRPEYSGEYAKYDFDLVFSGHLHGGQWGIPGTGLGVCGPSSGGPEVHERFLFPRMAGGAYTLNNGTKLVVSRGLARESTPLPRFFNHPEIVIINLGSKM